MIRRATKPLFALLAVVLAVGSVSAVGAQEQTVPTPTPPQVAPVQVTTLYPSVLVDRQDSVTFSLNIKNPGLQGQLFDLVVAEGPREWEPILRSRGFGVREMYLAGLDDESVDLQVSPPADAQPSDYVFVVKALGKDGSEMSSLRLTVGLQEKPIGGATLVTQFPMLRGPSSSTFAFKVDLKNDTPEERTFNLVATAPQNWQVTFKPAYEDKQITSISMKADETKTIDVEVKPQERAPAGEYKVNVQATAGNLQAEQELAVTLTGTYEMALSTPSGRLNAQATAGQFSPFTVLVQNTGTAPLQNVSLSSSKPDGWEVRFEPETLESIEPGGFREVAVSVKPSAKAIAGDYLMNLTASTPQTTKNVDIRTTVETPTVWGWMGAGIILVTMGGLYVIYRTVGRR